jgi:hypothetical protein
LFVCLFCSRTLPPLLSFGRGVRRHQPKKNKKNTTTPRNDYLTFWFVIAVSRSRQLTEGGLTLKIRAVVRNTTGKSRHSL